MAIKKKKRKRVNNKKRIRPVDLLSKLNKLKEGFFESDEIPSFVGVTKSNEFSLLDGSILPSGIDYHIDYNGEKKTESFYTGKKFTSESEAMIRLKGETTFAQYKRLKGKLKTQSYFNSIVFEPLKKDFKRGFSYRFFARERFGGKRVIEISETDYKKNSPMYTTIETRWYVGESKINSQVQNPLLVEKLVEMGFVELENLNPMEGYTGIDDGQKMINSLQQLKSQTQIKKKNKSNFRKGRKKRGKGRGTKTQSSSPAQSSGGGSAY